MFLYHRWAHVWLGSGNDVIMAWKSHWFIWEFRKQRTGRSGMKILGKKGKKLSPNLALVRSCAFSVLSKSLQLGLTPQKGVSTARQRLPQLGWLRWLPSMATNNTSTTSSELHFYLYCLISTTHVPMQASTEFPLCCFLHIFSIHFSNNQPHWAACLSPGNLSRYQLLVLLGVTKLHWFWEICCALTFPTRYLVVSGHYCAECKVFQEININIPL